MLKRVAIEKPEATSFILGHTHATTAEAVHETLVTSLPDIKFGLASCEIPSERSIRLSGNDAGLLELAESNAKRIAAGRSFILFLAERTCLDSVLNNLKRLPKVSRILCATAAPTDVMIVETAQGRGVLGVVDGPENEAPTNVVSPKSATEHKRAYAGAKLR